MTRDLRGVFFYSFVLITTCRAQGRSNFEIEDPKAEALYPKGFRITLKDDGYSMVGFRININKEFNMINEGQIKADIINPKRGYWVYKNRDEELQVGDTIFYWIWVVKNGKGRMFTDFDHPVTGFVNEDGTPVSGQISPTPAPGFQSTTAGLDPRFEPSSGCTVSKTMVQGQTTICKDALLFNEDFNATSIDALTQWDTEIKFPGEPDFPFNVYIPDNTVSLVDGSLVITPQLTESLYSEGFLNTALDLNVRCTGKIGTIDCKREASGAQILPPVITAKITTRRTFNFKFGKIEVRAKLPSGSWLIPEINLEPSDYTYGSDNYQSGLMRVAFARGNPSEAKKLYGGPVLTDAEPFRSQLMKEKIGIVNWYNDYHIYTMIWKPDGIDLLVDGEQYGSINPGAGFHEAARKEGVPHAHYWERGTIMAPLDQMFHITLGLRVGGVNDFSDNMADKPWKNKASKAMLDFWNKKTTWHPTWYNSNMKVDYVRVYAI